MGFEKDEELKQEGQNFFQQHRCTVLHAKYFQIEAEMRKMHQNRW